MKCLSAYLLAAVALIASAIPASSETIMIMSTGRDYLQRGRFIIDFRAGDLFVGFRDGNAVLAPCAFQPSPTIVTPNIFCPVGTTGFIADGDFNGDGLRDDLSFYSVSQVIPAILVEPFRPELCQLISAPPSDLPRPLGPFVDRGAIIFFNILTPNVYQFNVSMYQFARNYAPGPAGRKQMEDEIVYGTYIFIFPQLGRPESLVPIAVTYSPIPEAFDRLKDKAFQLNPFRFTSGVFDTDGNYLMDHRLTTEISWIGNDLTNTSPFTDELRISILDENEAEVLFPPSGADDPELDIEGDTAAGSLVIPNPLAQNYFLPPLLSGLEDPDNPGSVFGQQAFFRLRFARFRGTSAISYDASTRLFNFKILFVDSYQGFRILTFPTGQTDAQTRGTGDFDGDGQTNIEEYALLFGDGFEDAVLDPDKMFPDPVPTVVDGKVSYSMAKRPNGAALYEFEISVDGGNRFKRIGTNDPVWEITQNDKDVYMITTREAADPDDYIAKPRITEIQVQSVNRG